MVQREVTLNGVVAWVAWALAIIAAVATLALPGRGLVSLEILFAATGAALHARGFIHALEQRERNAFQLGLDASGERALHSLR